MVELLHALGAGGCASCGGAPASGGPLGALCDACAEGWPTALTPLRAAPEGMRAGWYLGPYAGAVGALVRRAKYGPDAALLDAVGEGVAGAVGRAGRDVAAEVDVVVAVPSAWTSLLWRGFVPAARVAGPVAAGLGVPLLPALVKRPGRRQAAVHRKERRDNVRVRASRPVSGRVLLVDDVLTTGTTAAACARVLVEAGASEVRLLVVAAGRQGVSSP